MNKGVDQIISEISKEDAERYFENAVRNVTEIPQIKLWLVLGADPAKHEYLSLRYAIENNPIVVPAIIDHIAKVKVNVQKLLRYVVMNNETEVAYSMYKAGVKLETNAETQSIMRYAARNGEIGIIQFLIKMGMNKSSIDICEAVKSNSVEFIKQLADMGANVRVCKDRPLYVAAVFSSKNIARYLLSRGADPVMSGALKIATKQKDDEFIELLNEYL